MSGLFGGGVARLQLKQRKMLRLLKPGQRNVLPLRNAQRCRVLSLAGGCAALVA